MVGEGGAAHDGCLLEHVVELDAVLVLHLGIVGEVVRSAAGQMVVIFGPWRCKQTAQRITVFKGEEGMKGIGWAVMEAAREKPLIPPGRGGRGRIVRSPPSS